MGPTMFEIVMTVLVLFFMGLSFAMYVFWQMAEDAREQLQRDTEETLEWWVEHCNGIEDEVDRLQAKLNQIYSTLDDGEDCEDEENEDNDTEDTDC